MKNLIKILALVVIVVLIVTHIILETYAIDKRKETQRYKEYVTERKKEFISNYIETQLVSTSGNEIYSGTQGTTSHFEGPQVLFEYVKFHNLHFNSDKTGEQMSFFDGNQFNFDPDHPYVGLPNVIGGISPVTIFDPEVSGLSALLKLDRNTEKQKPYRIYHKAIIPANSNDTLVREFDMQLWLTEFNVTMSIAPERKKPMYPPNSTEKDEIKYPGYWYASNRNFINLGELREEWKNYRYSDLTIILKIVPNPATWYYKSKFGQNARPAMGIGAIYCQSLQVTREQDENRISPNLHKGSVLFLHPSYNPESDSLATFRMPDNLEAAANKIFDEQEEKIDPIDMFWNKPFYIRLFFNNIGSWKEGFFGDRKYDDQVTFKFLMPIFVIGSWDIIPPKDIIPEWDPPKPYFRDFFKNILPTFGLNIFGKVISAVGWVLVVVILLTIGIPTITTFIGKIFK